MLGWMLKRGENAPDTPDPRDTTQGDFVDTPAPVFAARAFKSALFGTPKQEPQSRMNATTAATDQGSRTPNSKPQGILLTPGTGTSRPKRVSFGRDVEEAKTEHDPLASKNGGSQKRTRLNEALEKARRKKTAATNKAIATSQKKNGPSDDDDEWVEEDDVDEDEENYGNGDVTLDLNEPHSQSGKYWKEEFEKYRSDAKVELDKMLKYKQLAKSYAQQKDTEAVELAEKLRDEQQKVIEMEKKIAQNASDIISRHENISEDAPPELVSKLSKQTTLAVQYRQRVQELEDQLEDFLQVKQDEAESKGRWRRHTTASPRTHKSILETQRESRGLREQVSTLKSQLKAAEKRAAKAEAAKTDRVETSRMKDLRAQLREAKEESRTKDKEIHQLRQEFEAFKKESQTHEQDTKAVLERAHTKIADLKKEVRTLKATGPEQVQNNDSPVYDEAGRHEERGAAGGAVVPVATRSHHPDPGKPARRADSKLGVDTNNGPTEHNDVAAKRRTLREKYHDDAASIEPHDKLCGSPTMPGALSDRPNLEKPKWQPFVPRSPRNRAYLGEAISNGDATSVVTKPKEVGAQDLSALATSISRTGKPEEELETDRLHNRLSRLGGPHTDTQGQTHDTVHNKASKRKLPPERRAAALARIEQRRAERLGDRARNGIDKENVRP